jgi:hypothetical protein
MHADVGSPVGLGAADDNRGRCYPAAHPQRMTGSGKRGRSVTGGEWLGRQDRLKPPTKPPFERPVSFAESGPLFTW